MWAETITLAKCSNSNDFRLFLLPTNGFWSQLDLSSWVVTSVDECLFLYFEKKITSGCDEVFIGNIATINKNCMESGSVRLRKNANERCAFHFGIVELLPIRVLFRLVTRYNRFFLIEDTHISRFSFCLEIIDPMWENSLSIIHHRFLRARLHLLMCVCMYLYVLSCAIWFADKLHNAVIVEWWS